MKVQKKYQGIVIPAVTPLNEKFELDKAGVERMFANFKQHRVSPFILGTTGEYASLPVDLKTDYIKLAGKLKQTGEMLYVGISSNSYSETVDLARLSFDNGADALAVNLPSYYKLSESQIRKYFEQLADDCKGPLIIYNIPATTHMSIPLKMIDELSYHEHIVATKDSERNDERLRQSLELWAGREDFSYFLGWAARSATALLNGSDGLVPSTGNLCPAIYSAMYKAVLKGDAEKADHFQRQSDVLGNLYQQGKLLGESLWALKVLMDEKDICLPYVMPPLQPQSAEEDAALRQGLNELAEQEGFTFLTKENA